MTATHSADDFASSVLAWYRVHGRHQLPWQLNPSPYKVWISEIMLQQTQVATVIPYFERFMARFPDLAALAAAEQDEVLHLWTGLGYYARARNLHRCAQTLVDRHDDCFPESVEALSELPGIGRSTAGAILSLGLGRCAAILDGNVKRVLTRHFAIAGWPERSDVRNRLWDLAESLTPTLDFAAYNQAMMDIGATVCTRSRPECGQCPLNTSCKALDEDRIAELPGRKPPRRVPVRETLMLLCVDRSGQPARVLLQKRPPVGIWGGLWSLPECTGTDAIEDFCQQFPGLQVQPWQRKAGRRHSFTHFHLDITPVEIPATMPPSTVMDSGQWLWYPLDHSLAVGLAAPVRQLLQEAEEG